MISSVTLIPAVPTPRVNSQDASRGVPASAGESPQQPPSSADAPRPVAEASKAAPAGPSPRDQVALGGFSSEEQPMIAELRARDAEVRAHEQAHKSAAGRYAGSISYDYQTGPDGRRYAIGGEVPIDTAPEDSPEATISKMEIVIAAALAPTEPSPDDRAIAQLAQKQLKEAEAELRANRRAEANDALNSESAAPAKQAEANRGYGIQIPDTDEAWPGNLRRAV